MTDKIEQNLRLLKTMRTAYTKQRDGIMKWISDLDYLMFLKYLKALAMNRENKIVNKNAKSLDFLKTKRFGRKISNKANNIVNISSYNLSSTENFVLRHGLKFCVPPRQINRVQTFAEFEILASQLEHHEAVSKEKKQQLHAKLYDVSHSYCGTPVDKADFHMNKECADTARSLMNNKSIIISRPDKGGGIVIMDRSDYVHRMLTILSDDTKFIKRGASVKCDRTLVIERDIRKVLNRLEEKKIITKESHQFMHPTGSQTPRLYGLPKTHKDGIPLRPVLSMVGAPQYKLSKWLLSVLEPVLAKYSDFTVKDSFQFVERLRGTKQDLNNSFMCSYDVKSLFTNVPLLETLENCLHELYHIDLPIPSINQEELRRLLHTAYCK